MTNKEQGATMTQGQSEQSAKYKVGERVKFIDEDCAVTGVIETLTGRWLYNIERNGVCIAVGVTENMLDPADEDKAP
jgi:hypothetical protein